ncbi:MAG: Ig-like domain-containing protein, partial [Candidatus Curtissbacteria bacterium]|nr:Ig-like domain-containing protein [Candidatus Curtissbacteria bacterium]
SEYFIKGTEPTRDCLVEKTLDGRDYYVFLEFDPVSTDGKNRWQEGIDVWASANADSKYHVPNELKNEPGQNPDEINVEIKKPGENSEVDYSMDVEVAVRTGRKIKKVEFFVDGSLKDTKTDNSSTFNFHYNFDPSSRGKHKIKVRAENEAGKDHVRENEISVGEPWD